MDNNQIILSRTTKGILKEAAESAKRKEASFVVDKK